MILARHEFRIKYGKIKEAIEVWKEIITIMRNTDDPQKIRMLTDITGPAYTMIIELELRDLIEFGFQNFQRNNTPRAAELYQDFLPLCNSSDRTIYKIEV